MKCSARRKHETKRKFVSPTGFEPMTSQITIKGAKTLMVSKSICEVHPVWSASCMLLRQAMVPWVILQSSSSCLSLIYEASKTHRH